VADVCTSYSLALAVEDLLPVAFGAVGYWYLSRRAADSLPEVATPVRIAGLLLVVGSFVAGPLRKVLVVAEGSTTCFPALQTPFFSVLPACFGIIAWALWSLRKGRVVPVWPFALMAALGVIAALARDNRSLLLAFGGLLAVVAAVNGAILAWREGARWASVAFTVNGLGTLALPAIGTSAGVSDVTAQWLAQGINTISQAAFAFGCYRLFTEHGRLPATTSGEVT